MRLLVKSLEPTKSGKLKEWEAGERPQYPQKGKTEKAMNAATQILHSMNKGQTVAILDELIAKACAVGKASQSVDKARFGSASFTKEGMVHGPEAGEHAGKKLGTVGDVSFKMPGEGEKKPAVAAVAGAKPPPIPGAAKKQSESGSLKPGQVISLQSVKGARLMPDKSMSKAACHMLKDMMSKAKIANPANENGPVSGATHGGKGPKCTGCAGGEADDHGGKGPAQTSVGGAAHAGIGPAKTSASGGAHGGKDPAQTSVGGSAFVGNEGQMSKAMTASAMPRMPRAMAMAMDTWRSATNVLTRGNSRFAKNAGTGPLTPEVIEQVRKDSDERSTRHYHGDVLKSCNSCGRTYRISKGMEDCPTCSINKSKHCSCGYHLVKSHGGFPSCPICG